MITNPVRTWKLLLYIAYVAFCSKVLITQVLISEPSLELYKYIYSLIFIIALISSLPFLTRNNWLFILVLLLFFSLTYMHSRTTAGYSILALGYFAIVCQKIKVKEVAAIIFYGNLSIILLIFPLIFFSDYPLYAPDSVYGVRATYGFYNPNISAILILSFCISFCWYLRYKTADKITFLVIAIFACLIGIFLIDQTKSRTSETLLLVFMLGVVWSAFSPRLKFQKLSLFMFLLVSLTIMAFQFYTITQYNTDMLDLNITMSGRIGLGNILYTELGWPDLLYGVDIEPYTPIDFFFIAYAYTNGILLSLLTFYLIVSKIKSIKLDIIEVSAILVTLMTTLTERQILTPYCCLMLFIIFAKRVEKDA
ncbi:hypothetical protein ACIPDS_10070 [Kluyvera sp. NPDC087067]|uniref:hypothetical protein n=1 Tax=Kluyvera sp. NPDC087067 TaxID=3364105 RepID=UPI0037F3CFA2